MKGIIKKILFILGLFCVVNVVNAESFTLSTKIDGYYVKAKSGSESKAFTIQYIKDSKGEKVFCIEPFVVVEDGVDNYTEYIGDYSGYKELTDEQKRKIALIAYYGFDNKQREGMYWYMATQMLIWQEVIGENNVYFTDTYNGNKVTIMDSYMNQILSEIPVFKEESWIKDYKATYGEDFTFDFNKRYSIIESSSKDFIINSSTKQVTYKNVTEDIKLKVGIVNNQLDNMFTIYDSPTSQDVIRPGNIENPIYELNISVEAGDITLDIKKEDIVSDNIDFTNTCYEISNEETTIDKVCTDKDELIYKTLKIPFGTYSIKQVSVGKGYIKDTNVYAVLVDGSENITLNNNVIRNNIELVKYYCNNDQCYFEENAVFIVYDEKLKKVGEIKTNKDGYGSLRVIYGKYKIVQEEGLDNYTFVSDYIVDIENGEDKYYKELYNYYVEEEVEIFEDSIEDEVEDNIELPPKTGTGDELFLILLYNTIIVVLCICKLKKICYNS